MIFIQVIEFSGNCKAWKLWSVSRREMGIGGEYRESVSWATLCSDYMQNKDL